MFKRREIVTAADLADELNITPEYARNIISRLAREGLIEDTGDRVIKNWCYGNRKMKLWRRRKCESV